MSLIVAERDRPLDAMCAFDHGWMAAWPHARVTVDRQGRAFWEQPRCRLDTFGHRVTLPEPPDAATLDAVYAQWSERHRYHHVDDCVVCWQTDYDQAYDYLPPRGWRYLPRTMLLLDALPDPAPIWLRQFPFRGNEPEVVGLPGLATVARGPGAANAELWEWRWRACQHPDAYYVVASPYYRTSAAALVAGSDREGLFIDAFSMPYDRRKRFAADATRQVLHDFMRATEGMLWFVGDPSRRRQYEWLLRAGFIPTAHYVCLARPSPWLGPSPPFRTLRDWPARMH